jgi:hypothetical protein
MEGGPIVAIGRRADGAGEHTPHRADLVDSVVVELRRRTRHQLALVVVAADHQVAGIACLADVRSAPEIRRRNRAAAARRCAGDRRAPAEAIVAEGGRLAAHSDFTECRFKSDHGITLELIAHPA